MKTNIQNDRTEVNSLDLALAYIAEHPRHKIFPIARGVKTPPCIKNNLSPDVASNDIEVITAWHERWPGCNWGLALKASFVIVIDVDTKPGQGGQETFDALAKLHKDGWPTTLQASTPSGGRHYYYKGNHVFALGTNGFGRGIDSPNYVLIPGCELIDPETGAVTCYKWANSAPMADAPDWFALYLKKKDTTTNADTATPVVDLDVDKNVNAMSVWLKDKAPPSIENRNGDQTTLKVAMHLRDHGISQAKAVELMAKHYNVEFACEPLWSPEALEKKVENAYLYASLNAPGEMTEEGQTSPKVVEKAAKQAAADFAGDAPPLVPAMADADAADDTPKASKFQPLLDVIGGLTLCTSPVMFISNADKTTLSKDAFNTAFNPVLWKIELPNRYKDNAAKLAISLPFGNIERVGGVSYRPGEVNITDGKFNMWVKPPIVSLTDEPPRRALDHFTYLIPDEQERNLLLDWLAWGVQHPMEKIMFWILIVDEIGGTGKSWIGKLMEVIYGSANVALLEDNEPIMSSFNAWSYNKQFGFINEVLPDGKGSVIKKLKGTITEATRKVNMKGIERFDAENRINGLGATNDAKAAEIMRGDRRWALVHGTIDRRFVDDYSVETERTKTYYDRLWACIGTPEKPGIEAQRFLGWLKVRDVTKFNSKGNAPHTKAKDYVVNANRPDYVLTLDEALKERTGPFSGTLFTASEAAEFAKAHNNQEFLTWLRDLGCRSVAEDQIRLSAAHKSHKVRLWAINRGEAMRYAQIPNSKLAEAYETELAAREPVASTSTESAGEEFGAGA